MIRIQTDVDQYNSIINALKSIEKSEESVLKTGVNNTAKEARKLLATKASKRYTGGAGKRSTILGTSSILKATTSKLVATLYFESKVRDVKEYKVRVGKRGISAAVLNTGFKRIDGAFVTNLKWSSKSGESGTHEAVVMRVPNTVAKKYSGKPMKKHYNKIRKILSPSVEKQIKSGAYNDDEIADLLRREIDKVMGKVLSAK